SQIIERETNTFILDAYNANPSSMERALISYSKFDLEKKYVILGDMLELGTYSRKEHQRIFELSIQLGFEKVITVGPLFYEVNQSEIAFENVSNLKKWFYDQHFQNASFLLKGSRGIQLEHLLNSDEL
ncbi:MAG: cyanophycin synthetase, partial [Bacteroidota bacterium]